MQQREVARNEHTMNIRSGLPVLKTMYGMHIDEYDYLDIAVDSLRNIKHFGTTSYVAYVTVDREGKALLPCNMYTIDAVTTEHMGRKAFDTRVVVEMDDIVGTDTYYFIDNIMRGLGWSWGRMPGLAGTWGKGYISYQLEGKAITVGKEHSGGRIAVAFTGMTIDLEGYPFITRKQANALAAVCARVLSIRGANRGDKGLAAMVQFYTTESGRLVQAASIPEDITDNELDEVLNCKTSFNRKSVNRPTKYSR